MACSNIVAGLVRDCNTNQGGIDSIFIANGPVQSISETSGNVTAITVGGSALTPSDFFEFETPRQTSSLTSTITVSQEAGTATFDQQLTMVFNKMNTAMRNQLLLLAEATDLIIIAKDNNGVYWSVGLERGGYMISGTAASGTAYADANQMQIIVGGMEAHPMYTVDSSIVEA